MVYEKGAEMTVLAKSGWYLLKAIYFVGASFVFSYIFWQTQKWVESGCLGKKKKK